MHKNFHKDEEFKIIKLLLKLIKPYKKWLIISTICAIFLVACDIYSVSLITNLINMALNMSSEKIFKVLILVIGVMLIGVLSSYIMPYSIGRLESYANRDLRNKIIIHFDKVKVSVKETIHTGDLSSILNNDISIVESFIGNLSDYIYNPAVIIVTFTYLAIIQWKLVFLCTLSVIIALIISNKISFPMSEYNEKYCKCLGETNSLMQEAIAGVDVIKAFNLQEVFYKKCKNKLNQSLEIYDKNINVKNTLIMPIMFMVYEFPYVICAVYGGYLAASKNLSTSGLVAFILLLRFIVGPASQLPSMMSNIRSAAGACRRLYKILELETEKSGGNLFKRTNEKYDIEFQDVTFSYEENKEILKNLSFKIERGKSTALIGIIGCGKSTIFNLLCGFYKKDKGLIKIYGKNIEDWNLTSLRKELALVSQDTYLYPGSIEENIMYGREGSNREEVIEAAKKANAHDFIMKLSYGYDTLVGEKGTKLSGGQKQRIALARAILKDASVLLLDEPTSALDSKSQLLLEKSLKKLSKDKTVITIAHRLLTVKEADLLLVLDKGTIIESGTHEELISKGGLYKKLYLKESNNSELLGEGA